ncbi:MAG: hypothetical protein M3463_14990 [Verrucomicrobiota bacterium]|nr:hypothetical protein [Verrucomicrobiota bacterium]
MQASLSWGQKADWDFYLKTPNAEISYAELSADGFTLNHDAYPNCRDEPADPEIITGQGGYGTYRLYSKLFTANCGSPPTTFDAAVTVGDMPLTINGTRYEAGETFAPQDGVEFTVEPAMKLESRDRMMHGVFRPPDSWTGVALQIRNKTTEQDLGTYNDLWDEPTDVYIYEERRRHLHR